MSILIFSIAFVRNISQLKKKWARYDQKYIGVHVQYIGVHVQYIGVHVQHIGVHVQHIGVHVHYIGVHVQYIGVHVQYIGVHVQYIGVHVQYPLLLSACNENLIVRTDFLKILKYLIHENFANAPKKERAFFKA
jgi:hypothetical protein